jgi:hypothetical protein
MKQKNLLVFFFFSFLNGANAQFNFSEFNLGLRLQKTQNLYWENGLSLDYSNDFLLNRKIHLKASYVSSSLGSAIGSNAIHQESYIVGAEYRIRHLKKLQGLLGLNTGYFRANLEEDMFKVLPHESMLLSIETGISYRLEAPYTFTLSTGYNIIHGNGVSIPGTLFPVFYQLSLFYSLKR